MSIGLVRIANIKQLVELAFYLKNAQVDKDTHIHVACYHARQLLVLRNQLEYALDKVLKRNGDNEQAIFEHEEIRQAMAKSPVKHHIFMVLATPVAEVGRDHDYDWAIIEPSSMRSMIQLAGRVWRHRPKRQAINSNILIFNHNIRYLPHHDQQLVFTRPGFETEHYKLTKHDMETLIDNDTLTQIDAYPRIWTKEIKGQPETLAELEHGLMNHLFHQNKTNYVNAYWREVCSSNRIHTHLQQVSPFRHSDEQEKEWVLIPKQITEEYDDGFCVYAVEDIQKNGLRHANTHNAYIKTMSFDYEHSQISTWLVGDVYDELQHLQTHLPEQSLSYLAIQFSQVMLPSGQGYDQWYFCSFLGIVAERLSS